MKSWRKIWSDTILSEEAEKSIEAKQKSMSKKSDGSWNKQKIEYVILRPKMLH